MRINFSPIRSDQVITLYKGGDILVVNGVPFDFSQLPDGASLPAEAISSEYFAGAVERIAGELRVTLRLPHGANPSPAQAFPFPITVTEDGPVMLPCSPVEEGQPT